MISVIGYSLVLCFPCGLFGVPLFLGILVFNTQESKEGVNVVNIVRMITLITSWSQDQFRPSQWSQLKPTNLTQLQANILSSTL